MAKRIATLDSPASVRVLLLASLFHSREQRRGRQASSVAVPIIVSATPSGADVPVEGTSVTGALVIVYVDDTEAARTRADSAGGWSVTVEDLASGTYDFTATATVFGSTSNASVAEEVIVT